MKSYQSKLILKLNKNNFPALITKYLSSDKSHAGLIIKNDLKLWYKENFQQGNRWNKRLLKKGTIDYSVIELSQLVVGFRLLFNQEIKYNQTFINYLTYFIEERTAEEEGLAGPRIKISQNSYAELLHTLGNLKGSGEIQNSYRELAAIIYQTFSPETKLKPSTIIDMLKNQKGFK